MNEAARLENISVVVAASEVDAALEACLAAHQAECVPGDEILLVTAGGAESARFLAERFPACRLVAAPAGTLTPVLWARGLAAAAAPLVRVTIGPITPEAGWRQVLAAARAGGAEAVGGAIDPAAGLRPRDRAVYILRYRNYRRPFPRAHRVDVPGDHAAYLRTALERTRALWRDGFWEMDVNRALAAAGGRLVMDPDLAASYRGGESARRFLAQRFRHAIHFGRSRLAGAPDWRRLALALAFVLPGLIFLARILREAGRSKGRPRVWTVSCLPWLCIFLAAWSLGEWVGTLMGPPRPERGPG